MAGIHRDVLAVKQRLVDGIETARRDHLQGRSALEVCEQMSRQRDRAVCDLFEEALGESWADRQTDRRSRVALVAHGGSGRGDVAPYSDVDLMVLHTPAAHQRILPVAKRLVCDAADASLTLGHSVRTPEQAVQLACQDAATATSLIESRLLAGSEPLFSRFVDSFRRYVRRQSRTLIAAMLRKREQERARFGRTVYLLEPNIKRSQGALRDLQLLRWIGFARFGTPDPEKLRQMDVLSEEDYAAIQDAQAFLLRLRNELHFEAGKPADILDRAEQLRIAEAFDYESSQGKLPVERLMQDYFRHTNRVSHIVTLFVARAQSNRRLTRLVTAVFGHQVDQNIQAGPAGIVATERGLQQVRGNLTAIIRMADLANLYNKPIAPQTWEAVRRETAGLAKDPPTAACAHFRSLLSQPARLADLLRDLHEAGVLGRFVPAMEHARALLQFNQYHKYTVDEHCLRAVDFATGLLFDKGLLGRTYRAIRQKHVLHLALLVHDLGKGLPGDHCEVGLRIAQETAQRIGLPEDESEALQFLVHRHLSMNHTAFRRDTGDDALVIQFARQVGSAELLRMLFVMTAADLAAVGPGVWDGWKAEILSDLYRRAMVHLSTDNSVDDLDGQLDDLRQAVMAKLSPADDRPWFQRQFDALSSEYLNATVPGQIADDLRLLHGLGPEGIVAQGQYLPETETVRFTVGTREDVAEGVFHKLTGALSARGLQIRSAGINTLADGLVLDRFWVYDPDHAGEPPADRLEDISRALTESLRSTDDRPPSFRQTWQPGNGSQIPSEGEQTRVCIENSISSRFTVLDVFAHDRTGLLYTITRSLYDLGLSVWRAKISTYLDQVVDVFYVTDRQGAKVEDPERLEEIRCRLVDVVDARQDAVE